MKNMFQYLEELRKEGKRIGFTASSFDLLHPGHIAMLAEAKAQCDFLIVGLLTDPTISRPDTKNKPVQSTFERYIQIQAVEYVDWLIPFDTEDDLEQMIKMLKPDVRICGIEYKGTKHTGYDIPDVFNYYNRRDHNYSTTDLRKRIVDIQKHDVHKPDIIVCDKRDLEKDVICINLVPQESFDLKKVEIGDSFDIDAYHNIVVIDNVTNIDNGTKRTCKDCPFYANCDVRINAEHMNISTICERRGIIFELRRKC